MATSRELAGKGQKTVHVTHVEGEGDVTLHQSPSSCKQDSQA